MINSIFSHYINNTIDKPVITNYMLLTSFAGFCCWILYLELNPKLGNIWLREDAYSKIIFAPINIYNLIVYNLTHITFWYPWNWDMNCFIWTISGALIGHLI